MSNRSVKQMRVVVQAQLATTRGVTEVALFDAADNPITLGAATTSAFGFVKKAAVQADTTAADLAALKVDFNALLAKLKTAGQMASS